MDNFTSVEICAGAGGQAIGLEQAGFRHLALIEIEPSACKTLKMNRPDWNVIEADLRHVSLAEYRGVDLLSGGIPCPPFSVAGKQLGKDDERDLFPEVIRLTKGCNPKAVMIENVKGLLEPKFDRYRADLTREFRKMGYHGEWKLLNSSNFGVPQLRPRLVFVAMKDKYRKHFRWPEPEGKPKTVGEVLHGEMASRGWKFANEWKRKANKIAPTLVGGSKKHGGPDLGPTRARQAWRGLGVDGGGLADSPPGEGFTGMPRLTVRMVSALQGFPNDWNIYGKKTTAYRQIGNAFPPPVAKALGKSIIETISADDGG